MKISVIIPCFNAAQHLRQCLESVLSQTLEYIEIICIDDGSTDETASLLKKYESADNRVRVITQSNSGPGLARNLGIQKAVGEFVAFMDADDFYPDNQVLGKLYRGAIENNVMICGGSGSQIDVRTGEVSEHFDGIDAWGYVFTSNEKIRYCCYQFDYNYHRFIYKREFLLKNKIQFPELRRFEDPVFFVNAMLKAIEFYAIKDIVYRYRLDTGKVKWTAAQTVEALYGIGENLVFAETQKFRVLYKLTVHRLETHLRLFSHIDSLDYAAALMRLYEQIKAHTHFDDLKKEAEHLLQCALFAPRTPAGLGTIKKKTLIAQMLKSCVLFPWFVYKMAFSFYGNINKDPSERFCIVSFLKAFFCFPFYMTKSYFAAMELRRWRLPKE